MPGQLLRRAWRVLGGNARADGGVNVMTIRSSPTQAFTDLLARYHDDLGSDLRQQGRIDEDKEFVEVSFLSPIGEELILDQLGPQMTTILCCSATHEQTRTAGSSRL